MGKQEQFLEVIDRDEAERRFRAALRLEPLGDESVDVAQALGRVLAGDVVADVDVPSFRPLEFRRVCRPCRRHLRSRRRRSACLAFARRIDCHRGRADRRGGARHGHGDCHGRDVAPRCGQRGDDRGHGCIRSRTVRAAGRDTRLGRDVRRHRHRGVRNGVVARGTADKPRNRRTGRPREEPCACLPPAASRDSLDGGRNRGPGRGAAAGLRVRLQCSDSGRYGA